MCVCVCERACVRACMRACEPMCMRVNLICPCIVRSTGGLTVGEQNAASDISTSCLLRRADYQYTDGECVFVGWEQMHNVNSMSRNHLCIIIISA